MGLMGINGICWDFSWDLVGFDDDSRSSSLDFMGLHGIFDSIHRGFMGDSNENITYMRDSTKKYGYISLNYVQAYSDNDGI